MAFFPIFSGALTGLKAADPDLERLFDLYGASRLQRLLRLRLPSAVPYLLEGHKVAAGLAVIGAIVGEFVASQKGLGYVIVTTQSSMNTSVAFAALIWISVVGLLLYGAVVLAAQVWAPWAEGID